MYRSNSARAIRRGGTRGKGVYQSCRRRYCLGRAGSALAGGRRARRVSGTGTKTTESFPAKEWEKRLDGAPRLIGKHVRKGSIMADDASGSAPKHTVSPEDLNAATASVFEGHIGLVFTETTPDRVCATVAIGPELRQAARRRPWRCVLLHRGKRRQLGRSTSPRRRRTRRVPPKLLGTAAEQPG